MESLNISPRRIDVNGVLDDCVNNIQNSRYLTIAKQDSDWLIDNCEGMIDENLFQLLLVKAKECSLLLEIVAQTIDYAAETDISDAIFDMIMTYPSESRDDLIISLSHKSLSERQLLALCNYGITFEPYYELAIKYYIGDMFDAEQFKSFLENFKTSKYGYLYTDLLQELAIYKASCNKKSFLLQTSCRNCNKLKE